MQTVESFDKRILDLDMKPQPVVPADQKLIVVDAYARYRISDPLKLYQTVRDERSVQGRFGPIVELRLRSVLANASFSDIVKNKREGLMRQIAHEVNEQGKQFGIDVIDVRIKRVDLAPENVDSVYKRMQSDRKQEAEQLRAQGRAEANKIRSDAERDATVIKADAFNKSEQMRGEGDGERNRIFADAFGQDPEFSAFYRSMQAYESALKSGDTRMLLSPDFGVLPLLQREKRGDTAASGRRRAPLESRGNDWGDGGPAEAMNDLVVGLGLVLVVEGVLWAAFPGLAMRILSAASSQPEQALRIAGTATAAAGVLMVWLVRG